MSDHRSSWLIDSLWKIRVIEILLRLCKNFHENSVTIADFNRYKLVLTLLKSVLMQIRNMETDKDKVDVGKINCQIESVLCGEVSSYWNLFKVTLIQVII